MGIFHGFKFRTKIFVFFIIIIIFVLLAVMQLLYIVLKNSYRENAKSTLETQADQIAMNIDNKVSYYQTYMSMLLSDDNIIFAAENDDYKTLQQVLNNETAGFMYLNRCKVSKIQIYSRDIFDVNYNNIQPIFKLFDVGGIANRNNIYYTGTYLNDRNEKVFSLFMKLYQGNLKKEYLLEMDIYETELLGVYNKEDNNNLISVLNNGVLLSTSDRTDFVENMFHHKQTYVGLPTNIIKYSSNYFQITSQCNTGWNVVINANNDSLDQSFKKLYAGLIPVVLVILAIAAGFATLISNQLNRRFSILHRKIDYISQWDLTEDLRMNGRDEFKVLSDALENTKQRIIGLITQVKDISEQKKNAEISALRAQINSHFLFNALSSIKWLSRNEDKRNVSEAVDKLALFLRYSLSLEENQVLLKNEVEQLSAYIYLQKQRYGSEININVDIDEELMDCKTVKLLLQPLVENAIYHGRKETGALLNITIYSYYDDKNYFLVVEDDGNGISAERIEDIMNGKTQESSNSIGLRNVIDRIKICSDGQGELTIESKVDSYTKITVRQSRNHKNA